MVKRSIGSVIYAILASLVTFATYYLLSTARDSANVQNTLNDLPPAIKAMLEGSINNICTTFLVLAIATFALAILARYFKVANVVLNLLAWFYFFYGIIVLCLPQFILCLSAVSRNKKYFKKAAYVKSSAAYAEQNAENSYSQDEAAAAAVEADELAEGDELGELSDGELADGELSDGELADGELSDSEDGVADEIESIADEAKKPAKASKKIVIKKTKSIKNIFAPAYSVVLKSGDAENKKIIKMIRKSTGFSKKQANQYVENMPVYVKLNVPKKEAKKAYKKLTKLGCEAELLR